jgi:hypothetical protein
MSGLTFDLNTITFDTDTVTWDGGMFAGSVQLQTANGSNILLPLANVRTEGFTYDRAMFRSPYGTLWHQQGDYRRLVEDITVQAHVLDDANGISDAAIAANTLALALPQVIAVESSIGSFTVAALASFTRQPVESGYRFDIRFITFNGIQ